MLCVASHTKWRVVNRGDGYVPATGYVYPRLWYHVTVWCPILKVVVFNNINLVRRKYRPFPSGNGPAPTPIVDPLLTATDMAIVQAQISQFDQPSPNHTPVTLDNDRFRCVRYNLPE